MKTYKITNDFENFYTFTIKGVELYTKMPSYSPRFDASTRLDEWVVPDASFYATANYLNDKVSVPDITTWLSGNIVINKNVYELLNDKLKQSGEFLPVKVEGIDYYIFNTLKVIQDEYINTSKAIEVVDLGVDVGLENIGFSTEGLDGAFLFKSSTDHCLYSYCTEDFKILLQNHNLNGLLFEEIIIK